MSKLLLFLVFSFLQTSSIYAKKAEPSKVSRWEYLLKLIEEEEKTINMVKRKTDHLLYRQFELLTEKIKLYKEKENRKFLDMSTKGQKIPRKKAFATTLRKYEKARKFGLSIIRSYPRTRYKAAIYHTLALNSRDYAYDNRELGYLTKAIKLSRKQSEVWYLSMTSLAEYYYNNKKYNKAVSIYSQIIHNNTDEWHTKNLYNYGWCLLKTHKFDHAINRLEEGYKLSFEKNYIDFREQIMQSLVSFYVIGKQINRGIAFVMKYDKNPYNALTRFARKTSEKGFFNETEQLITLAEDNFDQKKKDEQLADLRLFQFDFYNQYKRDSKLFNIAKDLTLIKLNEYQQEEAVRKISAKSRDEQMILKKDFDKVASSYDVKRLSNLEAYFDYLSILDKQNEAMYRFFTAETLYSVQEFQKALKSYKLALETQLKTPSKMDLNRKAIDGIFSSIDFSKFSKEREKDELIYAYTKFLQLWPKDPKSPQVHQKLFAIYLSRSDHKNIEVSLNNFIKAYPKDKETHRKLFKQWMDLSIAQKKPYLLATLVNEMQKGKLGFQKAEIKKAEVILATLLFGKFQKMNKKGDTEGAITGYKKIFYDIHYPQSVKAEAGFNIGILYIDLSESAKSVKWFKKAFPIFSEKERNNKRIFLEKMSKRSALLQDFLNAAHIQRLVLDNFCNTKDKNLQNLQQSISFDLANDYALRALHTFKTYRKCVDDTSTVETTIITHLFRNSHTDELFSFVNSYKLTQKHKVLLSGYYERIFWKNYNNRSSRKSIARQMARLKDQELKEIIIGVSKHLTLSNKMDDLLDSPIQIGESFDPQKFNDQLSKRIASFVALVEGQTQLLEIGNPQLSLFVYDELAKALFSLSNEVASYSPKSAPKQLKQEFEKQMKIVSKTFLDQAYANIDAGESFMYKYELLSPNTRNIVSGNEALDSVNLRMPAKIMANTFDLEKN